MNVWKLLIFSRGSNCRFLAALLAFGLLVLSAEHAAADPGAVKSAPIKAFRPGEKLTYTVSWSNIFSAGTAVMEVKKVKTSQGADAFQFTSTARSIGVVDSVYPVMDVVQSIFDPVTLSSMTYTLSQSHGKKKKQRSLAFDHVKGEVSSTMDGKTEVVPAPKDVQDALSSVYYMRLRDDFTVGKPLVVNIHDSGKNWAVEVYTLGRETIKIPLGEFSTIKVKTYPKYDGVFMHKGEIFMWLTDDERKIPVLMKSTISIGSIVATLTDMKMGSEAP